MFRPSGGASRLTWRRLRVLVQGLPETSRTAASVNGGVPVLSRTEALLYEVADESRLASWQRYAFARTEKDPKPGKPPRPLPRPGDKDPEMVTEERFAAYAERRRRREQEVDRAG